MPKSKSNKIVKEHWFWNFTTKWYGIPSIYVGFALIIPVLALILEFSSIENFQSGVFYLASLFYFYLFLMPSGIIILLLTILSRSDYFSLEMFDAMSRIISIITYIIFYVLFLISLFIVPYYKAKKNITLKWLIIAVISLIVFAFLGTIFFTFTFANN